MDEGSVRAHVFVEGRVQGVFFRWETRDNAKSRGISGWVRNLADGRVEAVFEGSRDNVEAMIGWAKQGPQMAKVSEIDVSWESPEGLNGFEVR